jgi:hypothetical protein
MCTLGQVWLGPTHCRPIHGPAAPGEVGELAPHGASAMPRPNPAMTSNEVVGGASRAKVWRWTDLSGETGLRAHQRSFMTVTHASEGEPPAAGQRSSGGHRLRGRGAAMCSGGGCGGDGGVKDGWRRALRMGVLEEVDGR